MLFGSSRVGSWRNRTHLFQDRLYGPAALSASGVGYDAEGTHVVAAAHDGEVCAGAACWSDRQDVCVCLLRAQLYIHGALMLPPTGASSPLQHTVMLSPCERQGTCGMQHVEVYLICAELDICGTLCYFQPLLSTMEICTLYIIGIQCTTVLLTFATCRAYRRLAVSYGLDCASLRQLHQCAGLTATYSPAVHCQGNSELQQQP